LIVLDTSGLLAALFPDQREHEACRRVIETSPGPFLLSPFVLAELDHLVATHAGLATEIALLDEVAAGAYDLVPFDADDVRLAREVVDRYRDLRIGLADASLVVIAARHATRDILTLDERHFRALIPADGGAFRLLPADRS
jgi:uncharacterized protein